MIPRYTRPEMGKIWDERNEWQTMLDVEIAACEANAKLGRIPEEAVKVIKEKANFDVDRIHEIDHEINHDIIAFLTNVGEYVGDEAKYIHMGLTSTDVKDTGLNVQIKQASQVLIADLEKLAAHDGVAVQPLGEPGAGMAPANDDRFRPARHW